HAAAAEGLANSVRRSGDGKTAPSAFRTVHIREQYGLIKEFERTSLGRSSSEIEGSYYDVWMLAPAGGKEGEPEAVYFEISPLRRWGLHRFGVTE
ncbi:MAG: hypothetical protein COB53_04850, partial [Elusimicrobia bacterium]